MARIGLGSAWRCTFANEWSDKKASSYREYFGNADLRIDDVADVTTDDLPGVPTLAWASFPCQDLSLAGSGAGLKGERSGTFKVFWKLVDQMVAVKRAPKIVVLENVVGTLSSHGGRDFATLLRTMADSGYAVGALVIDAVHFLPQSRPRLFIIGVQLSGKSPASVIPASLTSAGPLEVWHTAAIRNAYAKLPKSLQDRWVWWRLPLPNKRNLSLDEVIEGAPQTVEWHTPEQTAHLLSLMSPLHLAKVETAKRLGKRIVGTVYKRTRQDENGSRIQRAEVRFDQIAGCLRTPGGGSSRQTIIVVEGKKVRTRLLAPREAARLMGVQYDYPLPARYNDSYHLF